MFCRCVHTTSEQYPSVHLSLSYILFSSMVSNNVNHNRTYVRSFVSTRMYQGSFGSMQYRLGLTW